MKEPQDIRKSAANAIRNLFPDSEVSFSSTDDKALSSVETEKQNKIATRISANQDTLISIIKGYPTIIKSNSKNTETTYLAQEAMDNCMRAVKALEQVIANQPVQLTLFASLDQKE